MEYVDCIMCPNWTLEFRHREFCKICNNTGKMQDPATILCNNCGDCMCSLNNIDQPCNYLMPNGLLDIKVSGSYDSDHLTDTIEYTFNLCEKCIRGMFKAFKIKPILNNWADKLSCYS
jgi:hypothetical protein